ncbi:DNA polymerase III, delta subunit (plasmid) [Legionella adelaidensis]|uniref:DNA polymerase III subunit delta n=1 Tax=Legionella adelaidensis TaxID=45056 RepID=A0A0W0R467_9GAMM|nr:DNA polymerase III subunit delta [Legionella adelaidensis]KTC65864.1 DNA polymerase III, delta subunit [Legionella adelaidensis]VEH85294.1 DNA polymerase III, delta subunit [Legionella adelaidensis]
MLIKQQGLSHQLGHAHYAIYVLIGQEPYLLEISAQQIKNSWREKHPCDQKIIDITNAADWSQLLEEANSYSLFAEYVLLDVRYEKKNFEEAGKKALNNYLEHINSRSLILLRAANLPAKQLQWLSNHKDVLIVQSSALTPTALGAWVTQKLKEASISFEPGVAELIHRYAQGNMLACAQTVDKLRLMNTKEVLTVKSLQEHLIDQCEFQTYELTEACLQGNYAQAIHILRWASKNKTEPTLLLWLLTQEIRVLIELHSLINAAYDFKSACAQLKIWPQRQGNYQRLVARLSLQTLYAQLELCKKIDDQIKTSQGSLIWIHLEKLILEIAKGQGGSCSV